MSSPTTDPVLLSSPLARGLSTFAVGALGVGAGLALSYPAILFPSVRAASALTALQKLAIWKGSYDAGVATIVPLPLIGSISFIAAAVSAHVQQDDKPVPLLSAAAVFSLSHIVFTLAKMVPTNSTLIALGKKTSLSPAEAAQAEALIEKWLKFHNVRVAGLLAGLACGLTALFK